MHLMISWLIMTVSIGISAYLLPGITLHGFIPALLAALFLGVVNTLVRPILLLVTLPINILTLGLFTFVVNALLVLLASKVISGFEVNGFWWAVLFSIILSVIQSILHHVFRS